MSGRVQINQIVENTSPEIKDTVVFMTAYNLNKVSKKISNFWQKDRAGDLLSEFRISTISTKDTVLTPKGRLKYASEFHPSGQSTTFNFEVHNKEDEIEDYQEEINELSLLTFKHSIELLLDRDLFEISFYFNMERFLVSINSRTLQVDPIAFILNEMIFISYELIDFDSGHPLDKDAIYGRSNNYNIIPVDGVKYFDEDEFTPSTRKISDVLFDNITGFIEKLSRNKFQVDSISYVHNIFVISNSITHMEAYFQDVLGAYGLDMELKNLSTNNEFQYYSQEYLGVVTKIAEENLYQGLYDCQLLEALKMYFSLKLIVNYKITDKLKDTINKKVEIDGLLFPSGVPIITLNAIDNMKKTETYKRFEAAVDFKISYLNLLQERGKNKNALLLNILLYLLALISGISTLQVLQTEFGWSFKTGVIVLVATFIALGVFWIWQERKQ